MGLLSLNLPVIGQSSATEDQKIRDGLASIQTLLNGNVDEANVPNLAAAFTTYGLVERGAVELSAPAAGTFMLGNAASGMLVGSFSAASSGAARGVFSFDPALFAANARTTKLHLSALAKNNVTAPAVTFTVNLFPVTAIAGASGAAPTVTLGAAVTGSTATLTTPAASAATTAVSGDFTAPAAGQYVVATAVSGAAAAGSVIDIEYRLHVRRV